MHSVIERKSVFFFAMISAAFTFVSGTSAGELLEEVRAGNKAAIESIRTLSCRITVANPITPIGPMEAATVDYWRSGDSWRVRCPLGAAGDTTDWVQHDFVSKNVMQSAGTTFFAITRADPDDSLLRFDPYANGLLKLFGPGLRDLTLEKILKELPHKLGKITRQPYQGHECVVLKISTKSELDAGKNIDFEIWFDPQVNYLACKLIREIKGRSDRGDFHNESRVLRFTEAAPGIYFPAEMERKCYTDGKLTTHDIVTCSDIRVNQPLPPGIFELPIPPNSTVMDAIQDREYKVDALGKAFGPERSLPKYPPLPAGSGQPPGKSQALAPLAQFATTTEPQSMTRWFVYGFLFVLAVSCSIWHVLRWRAGAASG